MWRLYFSVHGYDIEYVIQINDSKKKKKNVLTKRINSKLIFLCFFFL